MTSMADSRGDYDFTALPHVLRRALLLGVITAAVVVALAFITRLTGGIVEAVAGGAVLLAGLAAVTALPGIWTRARTIEGIAGAAGIGLAGTVVFMLLDVALLQPLGVYTNRWREVGGGSNWWYHPVWWMVGTFLPWMGAVILANRAARGRDASPVAVMVPALLCAVVFAVIAIVLSFPRANWSLSTFGIAFLPGVALAAALSAVGRRGTQPMRWLRLFLHAFGWLLTPFMAWAASFFGCVAGEVIATRMASPGSGLLLSAGLGALAGFVTLILWLRLLRRSPELQQALAVTPEGVPDTAIHMDDDDPAPSRRLGL